MGESVFITLFLGFFLLIGVALLGFGGWAYVNGTRAANWPVVEGAVISSNLEETSDSEGDSYAVDVEYAYSAGGVSYTGSRIAFGYSGSSGRSYHKNILDRLPAGARVGVRYDPADPSRSVLAFGANKSIYFLLVFGSIWTIFVLGFIAIVWMSDTNFGDIADKLIVYG